MTRRTYTIGQISRLSGLPVRRLRFYADKGLLPPVERTESGYRVFTDADLIRIDLIRALRDAGLGLEAIRDVLSSRLSITDVLTLRLAEIETQINSQRRVATAIRAALRSPEPTNDDLRRIWTMTNLSQSERSAVVQRFFDKVASGVEVDPKWKQRMVKMSTPDLPDNPTTEQIDAWIELSKLMDDPAFLGRMRENAKDSQGLGSMDAAIFQEVNVAVTARARDAIAQGLEPASDAGRAIADDYLKGWARAHGIEPTDDYFARMRRKHLQHRQTLKRYWDLVSKVGGLNSAARTAGNSEPSSEWLWIDKATMHRFAATGA